MANRSKDIKDWIPARGEAEVTAKLKGAYGGKAMRSRGYRRSSRRGANSNPKTLWSLMDLESANHNYAQVNTLGGLAGGQPYVTSPQRMMKFNPLTPNVVAGRETVGTDEQDVAFLKRLIIKVPILAQVQALRNGTSLVASNLSARDDFPFNGAQFPDGGLSGTAGHVLSDGIASNGEFGAHSWAEGIPLVYAMLYETYLESQDQLGLSFEPAEAHENIKNRREFFRDVTTASVYKPGMIKIDKTFPGKGIRLSIGDRETFQVTLAVWQPTTTGSTLMAPVLGFFLAQARAMYSRL